MPSEEQTFIKAIGTDELELDWYSRVVLLVAIAAVVVGLFAVALDRQGYLQDLLKDLAAGVGVFAFFRIALKKKLHQRTWFTEAVTAGGLVVLAIALLVQGRFWQSTLITVGVSIWLFAVLDRVLGTAIDKKRLEIPVEYRPDLRRAPAGLALAALLLGRLLVGRPTELPQASGPTVEIVNLPDEPSPPPEHHTLDSASPGDASGPLRLTTELLASWPVDPEDPLNRPETVGKLLEQIQRHLAEHPGQVSS
jgi:hypothetical protein